MKGSYQSRRLVCAVLSMLLAVPIGHGLGMAQAAEREAWQQSGETSRKNLHVPKSYLMTPGDELDIFLASHQDFYDRDYRHTYVVRPDGMVSYPLAGDINTTGMTVEELEVVLTKALSRYYIDPLVTVNILHLGTVRVHVLGEVTHPGTYELQKSHCMLDAIGAADGFTRDTAKKNVFLVHKDHEGEPIKLNLNDLLTKGDVSQNYELREDDVLYLTRNGRIDFGEDILPWITGARLIDAIVDHYDNRDGGE